MKQALKKASIMMMLALPLLMSCGEDRTYEYVEKTQHNHWIYDEMKEQYLWADNLADFDPAWKNYFSKPSEFVALLAKKSNVKDVWSYVEIDTIVGDPHSRGYFNHNNSYGFDFMLITDPTGQTTKQFARVISVYDNSPAQRAGLQRNDFIASFNGYKITNSNATRLASGVARTLDVNRIGLNDEGEYVWKSRREVSLGASCYVEDKAFPVDSIIRTEEATVGYLKCNRLVPYPIEDKGSRGSSNTPYQDDLDAVFNAFSVAQVKELVLDLRDCNYGTIEMAQRLASYIVEPQHFGTTFASTVWNQSHTSLNCDYKYDSSVSAFNLALSRIYIIIGEHTQGAPEWLIHSLQATMRTTNVTLIGLPTKGQNVMTQEIGCKYYVHLCPSVAYVADSKGDYEYGALEPTIQYNEFQSINLAEYGTPEEILLNAALQRIKYDYDNAPLW